MTNKATTKNLYYIIRATFGTCTCHNYKM